MSLAADLSPVLVTGADGFVGRRLGAALEHAGHRVLRHSLRDGDIARCDLPIASVCRVFHLAALNFVPASWNRVRDFSETNVLGTINVLEFCRRAGAPLTYVSSYVYGHPRELPVAEDHPRDAANPYALTKILAEDACLFYQKHLGVPVCIVRPFNLYGPGQGEDFLIPTLVRQATDPACDRIVVADDRPCRDFLYISDFVDLLLATMRCGATGIYNAGSGTSVSIGRLAAAITSITGPKPLVSRGEHRRNEIMDVRANIAKAARDLGWKPRTALEDGLREVLASH